METLQDRDESILLEQASKNNLSTLKMTRMMEEKMIFLPEVMINFLL